MGEIPGEATPQLEGVEDAIARLEEIRAELTPSLEECAEPAPSLVRDRRAEGGGCERHEVAQAFAPLVVGGEPVADDEHAGGMDDRVERLAGAESGALAQRAVEPFGDVLDADLVRQRLVRADRNVVRIVAGGDECVTPGRNDSPRSE